MRQLTAYKLCSWATWEAISANRLDRNVRIDLSELRAIGPYGADVSHTSSPSIATCYAAGLSIRVHQGTHSWVKLEKQRELHFSFSLTTSPCRHGGRSLSGSGSHAGCGTGRTWNDRNLRGQHGSQRTSDKALPWKSQGAEPTFE